jgi:hypothetical protein
MLLSPTSRQKCLPASNYISYQMKEILSLLSQELPTSSLQTLNLQLTFDRFLSDFYYDEYPCIRYRWFATNRSPKQICRKAFDIYCHILGLQFYIGLDRKTSIQRYNNFKLGETLFVVESKIHKRVLYESTTYETPFNVLWIESLELTTIKQTQSTQIIVPSHLPPKSHRDVDSVYCPYCCYQLYCLK